VNKLIAISFLFFVFGNATLFAQTAGEMTIVQDTTSGSKNDDIDPLTPAKAAFYSAILPGLGQAYNKKYWKMPLVYGAIGASVYFYSTNNTKYHEFRDVYKRRLAGYTDDNYRFLSDDRLIRAQQFYQKNRDLSALITAAFYVLNIVDANVDAHLKQFNVDDNLSFQPAYFNDDIYNQPHVGVTLNYRF
jgi:hypothetical protein